MTARGLVVDASALLDSLLVQPNAVLVNDHLFDSDVRLHAPDIVDEEVLSVFRRLERAAALPRDRARQLLDDLRALPMTLHPLRPHLARVWTMRTIVTVADGYYVSLSEALRAPLLTTDRRLAREAREQFGLDVVELS